MKKHQQSSHEAMSSLPEQLHGIIASALAMESYNHRKDEHHYEYMNKLLCSAVVATTRIRTTSSTNTDTATKMRSSPPFIVATSPSPSSPNKNPALHTRAPPPQSNTIASLLAGFGSGALSSIVCAPLDLIRTRMQVIGDLKQAATTASTGTAATTVKQRVVNTSLIQGLRDIIKADGVAGCFRGLGPTLLTVPTFWSLYFPLYERLKHDLNQRAIFHSNNSNSSDNTDSSSNNRVPPLVHMSAAILSGAYADFFCNPMFIVRTRMQTEALHYLEMPMKERKPHGIIQTVKSLYNEGGIRIFWRGFAASLLGLSHVAIQFPTYEFFKAEARERSLTNEESALDLLFASGISKMIATSLTYPHEVVRSRMMDQRGDHTMQKGLIETFKRIIQNEGVGAMYSGVSVSLVRVVPNCCITFMTYELILRWVKSEMT